MATNYILTQNANAGTIFLNQGFDINKDIVVNFDYACYGEGYTGSEGFSVFFTSTLSALSGGGPGPGLCYSPVQNVSAIDSVGLSSFPGVQYGALGIGFDITGNFATNNFGIAGLGSPVPNSITIRDNFDNNYNFLYNSGNLNSANFPYQYSLYQQISSINDTHNLVYNRVRVRLSDFGQRVLVDIKRPTDYLYTNFVNYTLPTTAWWPDTVYCCLGFATGRNITEFKIQNLNVNGVFLNDYRTWNYGLDQTTLSGSYFETPFVYNDLDYDNYINTAGITDPTARVQLYNFITGIKSLGLWNNMVCWPMISTQNASISSTIYSLGGLGSLSGSLQSGNWSTSGLYVSGSNSNTIGSAPYVPDPGYLSAKSILNFGVAQFPNAADVSAGQSLMQQYPSRGAWIYPNSTFGGYESQILNSGGGTSINTSVAFNSYATLGSIGSTALAFKNTTQVGTDPTIISLAGYTSTPIAFGSYSVNTPITCVGYIPFAAVFLSPNTGAFSASTVTSIYNLYASTLGSNLPNFGTTLTTETQSLSTFLYVGNTINIINNNVSLPYLSGAPLINITQGGTAGLQSGDQYIIIR